MSTEVDFAYKEVLKTSKNFRELQQKELNGSKKGFKSKSDGSEIWVLKDFGSLKKEYVADISSVKKTDLEDLEVPDPYDYRYGEVFWKSDLFNPYDNRYGSGKNIVCTACTKGSDRFV